MEPKQIAEHAALSQAALDQEWRELEAHVPALRKIAQLDDGELTDDDLALCIRAMRLVCNQISTYRLARFMDEIEACGDQPQHGE